MHSANASASQPSAAPHQAAHAASVHALVHEHLPLVRGIARKIHAQLGGRMPLDELVSLGSEGLVEAAYRFDPSTGARFKTYAFYRIRGAMLDGVGTLAPLTRSAYRRLRTHGVPAPDVRPTAPEPTEFAGTTDTDGEVYRAQMRALLERAIAELPAPQQEVIRACYFEDLTILDAGKRIGKSKSWACRLHARALADLRDELERLGVMAP